MQAGTDDMMIGEDDLLVLISLLYVSYNHKNY